MPHCDVDKRQTVDYWPWTVVNEGHWRSAGSQGLNWQTDRIRRTCQSIELTDRSNSHHAHERWTAHFIAELNSSTGCLLSSSR